MKRILMLFCVAILCWTCGCNEQNIVADAPLKVTQSPAPSILQQPPAIAPTPVTQPIQQIRHLPLENRVYFERKGVFRMLSGQNLTKEALNMLSILLRMKQWDKLSVVLNAFGIILKDADYGNTDILREQLVTEGDYPQEYEIRFPQFDEKSNMAYIAFCPPGTMNGMTYLLLFSQVNIDQYQPLSIIEYYSDTYEIAPIFHFTVIGAYTYMIWTGFTDHGTCCMVYTQRWYEVQSGRCVMSFDTDGYEIPTGELREEGIELIGWKGSVSQISHHFGELGDFFLNADTQIETFNTKNEEESYRCRYEIYFDASKYAFYTSRDSLMPIFEQAAQNGISGMEEWAAWHRLPFSVYS